VRKLTIQDAIKEAKKHKGKCISKEYVNSLTYLEWECEIKHRWLATLSHIRYGTWCPNCANNVKLGLVIAQQIAKERGGKCISTEYINNSTNLKWECKIKHRWKATLQNIKNNNSWCPECYKKDMNVNLKLKNGLKIAQQTAKKMGGKCISSKYINCREKMEWECIIKHRWFASLDNVKNHEHWCAQCSNFKSQNKLKEIVDSIFKVNSISNFRGFDWLKTKNTGKQEIDIYIPKLKIAIEYDGKQHFEVVKIFGGKIALNKRKKLDRLKNKKIKQHPKDINYFVRFNYKDKLNVDNVIKKLRNNGIVIKE